ncbi:MAG TPA: MBL fold metallo-hydrolase [Vicinamibacterales bacterium]|nr:MBL fold metallo-hydrolase [Vicinamibacterales bacterium]
MSRHRIVCALFAASFGLATVRQPEAVTQQAGLRMTYFGAAGWEITDGRTVVLVDPYFTRAKYATPNDPVSPDDPRPITTNASIVASDTKTIDAHVTRADVIVITHTHPDHTLDLPYIAIKTGATVVGTESTATMCRLSGVPAAQLKVVSGHEALTFGSVSIRVIPSLHGIFRAPAPGAPAPRPPIFIAGAGPPFAYGQFQEGGTLAYDVKIAGHEIVLFGSMNFIESELTGLHPDIALIGSKPERAFIENYTPRLMNVLNHPRLVMPTHWDAFNVPYDYPQDRTLEQVKAFTEEVKAASPGTTVYVPERLKPVDVEALLKRIPAGIRH